MGPLNIAITGSARSGKSSFINAIRGLTADDDGAAAVGVDETTREPTRYEDPNNQMLIFWDLPPVGTHDFTRETYLNQVQFEKYNVFLIFCRTRFTENDIWLAKKLIAQTKKVFFIRTCIDVDITNNTSAHPKSHDQSMCINQIRADCEYYLRQAGITRDRVYLIDNYKTTCHEFGNLCHRLGEGTPYLKHDDMTLYPILQDISLNIAIIGNLRSGKSRFINSVRGLTADDDGAAAVGVVDTTSETTVLTFWDLPRLGTHEFKRETYLNQVQFEKYDIFLIFSRTRLIESDIWLAKALIAQTKKVFFIRTCIDVDIKNKKRAHPKTHDQSKCINQIRADCENQLRHLGLDSDRVYLTSSYETQNEECIKLQVRLLDDLKGAAVSKLETMASPVISQDEANTIKQQYTSYGDNALKLLLERKMYCWRNKYINVGIVGNSGTGKSSFINAIRGMDGDDVRAAAVGVIETTRKPTAYYQPGNDNMVYWDLPGVGTEQFPRTAYLDQIDMKKYDFFLILGSIRFTENDVWLAKAVRSQNKKFFFIRTKIESDLSNDKKSHPRSHNEHKVIEKIRADCNGSLKIEEFETANVFLIDNYCPLRFDFSQLSNKLIEDVKFIRRDVIVLSLALLTKDVLQNVTGVRAILINWETVVENKVLDLAKEFRVELELTPRDLENHARELCLSGSAKLKDKLELQSTSISCTKEWIHEFAETKSSVIAKVIPFFERQQRTDNAAKLTAALSTMLHTMVRDYFKIKKAKSSNN